MGTTRDTGYLRNLVIYDGSGNITLPANLTVTGTITGYATTSYVTTQINNLINGAPGLLDTLDELAAALGDDANFAATLTTSLSGKQSTLTFTGPLVNTSGTVAITQSSGSTNGFLSNTDWTTFNSKQSTLTFSGPLVNTTGTISITQSSGSTNGYLSNTDWSTFNNKQAALSGTGFVKISGTTISYDNSTYLTTASATSTYLPLAGGTLTGALSGTSATFSGGATFFYGGNTFAFEQNVLNSGNSDGAHIRSVVSVAANPTYSWAGDTDTGMYKDSANTISFSTNGVNRLTIGTTGVATFNVPRTNGTNATSIILSDTLTGISTPGYGVRLYGYSNGTGTQSAIGFENGGTGTNNESQISFYTQNVAGSLTRQLLISSTGASTFTGNITATTALFNVNASSSITLTAGGTDASLIKAGPGDELYIGGNDTWQMRLSGGNILMDNGGNVGINTSSPTARLDINGDVRYRGGIYDQFNFVATGNYTNGTYYNIVGVNAIATGIYILQGEIDTYAVGGGIYFMRFVSVPFYMWDVGSNSVTFVDLPPVLGTGHHLGAAFPLFRLQMTGGGTGIFLQFNPNTTWAGLDNVSGGKSFRVNLKRIG